MPEPGPPIVSICIPSYNRAEYLPVLFQSVERELANLPGEFAPDCVEVVLCDNASTDETPAIAAAFAAKVRLTYVRHAQNIGPDRNFLAVIEHARGQFCWLMGSDDALEAGGLAHVLASIARWNDVAGFSLNYQAYDSELRHKVDTPEPVDLASDALVEGSATIFTRFIAHWGFISGSVVRRELWNQVCQTHRQFEFLNGYVHVYVISQMIIALPAWGYVSGKCVQWRSGNDSFLIGSNWLRRMKIDVVGYHDIAASVFGERSSVAARARDRIAGSHILSQFRSAKARGQSSSSLRSGALLLTKYYWKSPVYWTALLPWILVPRQIVRVLFGVYQRRRERRLASRNDRGG